MSGALRSWYAGRRVVVTGHTGFKGAWLSAWLARAGASVVGYALAPPADRPSLFASADIAAGMRSVVADVRDRATLEATLRASAPEIVFHMAAQSLVRQSYREPVETYATNVMGTAHVLDAARRVPSVRALVVVTSDKCYENRDLARGYAEDDPVGGFDPYSSSKGCAELVASAYRRSFCGDGAAAIATVRAGNVIGGGDWAEDRLLPDLARAASRSEPACIRNPDAVRPWQFVLEPLRGYLLVARALVEHGEDFAEAWNFGPRDGDAVPVRDLVVRLQAHWPAVRARYDEAEAGPHEARLLRLDCAKAERRLGWKPVLDLNSALEMTMTWYRSFHADPGAAARLVAQQLDDYERRVAAAEARP